MRRLILCHCCMTVSLVQCQLLILYSNSEKNVYILAYTYLTQLLSTDDSIVVDFLR